LHQDTVQIIGATLDLQEKTASQAMTQLNDVFMLHIDARLDYDTLRTVCAKGHSRVPVYEEVDLPGVAANGGVLRARRILGVLLVKQCVLLDPKDAVPVRSLPLNRVPTVAQNESLLGILDRFQQGHSHMAIVSRLTIDKAASVKQVVKKNLTQRIKDRVGMNDSSDSDSSDDESEGGSTIKKKLRLGRSNSRDKDAEKGDASVEGGQVTKSGKEDASDEPQKKTGIVANMFGANLEQNMPADAVLNKEGLNKVCFNLTHASYSNLISLFLVSGRIRSLRWPSRNYYTRGRPGRAHWRGNL
jgi:metal transporter CNNM